MIDLTIDDIKEFSKPYYENKDFAHDFSHAEKVFKLTKKIANEIEVDHNNVLIACGAFFHGFDKNHKQQIIDFLSKKGVQKNEVSKIMQVTRETHNTAKAVSTEGKILHDAHLLEGESYSIVIKSIITGINRDWSLQEIIKCVENKIGSFECNYAYTRNLYNKREEFAKKFASQMRVFLGD